MNLLVGQHISYKEHIAKRQPQPLPATAASSGLGLDASAMRDAHGIGRDSLSSRSGESGLAEAWDPASPDLPHIHSQQQLKQAISQVA